MYESDSDELEIEGITNIKVGGSSKPPSILKSLLAANTTIKKSSNAAPAKKSLTKFELKKYDQDDFDLLFKKRPDNMNEPEEKSEEEQIVKRPKYLPRNSEDEADFVEHSNLQNAYH